MLPVVRDYVLVGSQRIKDRRTGMVVLDTRSFLNGEIDEMMAATIKYRGKKRR